VGWNNGVIKVDGHRLVAQARGLPQRRVSKTWRHRVNRTSLFETGRATHLRTARDPAFGALHADPAKGRLELAAAPALRTLSHFGSTMKTLLALRHVAFEDLGRLAPLMEARGWSIHYHDVGEEDLGTVDLGQADLLVVLGGPIGAEEEDLYPFLADEVALVRERLAAQRPLLGICLGAQLIARALGARVRPMDLKEIGFAPLQLTPSGHRSPLSAVGRQPVLHWHGDAFDLPQGISSLARTAACANQAFCVGQHAMAWQFHLEFDSARLESWLIGHAVELAHAGIAPGDLRQAAEEHGAGLETALRHVMGAWLEPVEGLTP
jgi:GMP synthase (glutamine-hydrolysing)